MPNTPPTRSDVANLAVEIRTLTEAVSDRDRHFKIAIGLGTIALLIAFALAWNARVQSQEAKEQAAAYDELAEVQELDRCRGANAARQGALDGFEVFANALITATTPTNGDPDRIERHETMVTRFREGLSTGLTGLRPVDCTGDSTISEVDFPPA